MRDGPALQFLGIVGFAVLVAGALAYGWMVLMLGKVF